MKICTIILIVLLSGCAVNITPNSFIYQDDQVESQLDLNKIQTKVDQAPALVDISQVSLTTKDGLLLKGVKLLHKDARINVIFFGGSGMKISTNYGILKQFALLPANVIWFDYRGVGVSEGKSDLQISDFQSDALNVFDFASNNLPSKIPTAIHGLSMGSLLASYTVNQRMVDALILDGAINSVSELVDNVVPTWSKIFATVKVSPELATINNTELIKNYKEPLLFLIGEDDSVTPVKFSQELYDASGSSIKTLTVIANTEHGQPMAKDKAIDAYKVFIAKLTFCENG